MLPPGEKDPEAAPAPAPSPAADDGLFTLLYDELRRLAQSRMAQETPGNSLQATALVHEVWLRLASERPDGWASRAQFFTAAAEAMRRILVERARARRSHKRGGDRQRVTLSAIDLAAPEQLDEVLAVDEVFRRLEGADARAANVVRLRFFAGLGEEEVASALDLSVRTVRREWAYARAWLFDALARSG
jgi:RNA polymerase sigma factor (TIGR02999 family)